MRAGQSTWVVVNLPPAGYIAVASTADGNDIQTTPFATEAGLQAWIATRGRAALESANEEANKNRVGP